METKLNWMNFLSISNEIEMKQLKRSWTIQQSEELWAKNIGKKFNIEINLKDIKVWKHTFYNCTKRDEI